MHILNATDNRFRWLVKAPLCRFYIYERYIFNSRYLCFAANMQDYTVSNTMNVCCKDPHTPMDRIVTDKSISFILLS